MIPTCCSLPGSSPDLKNYYQAHPDSRDLLQGPLLKDTLARVSTHWHPVWRDQMWGVWSVDRRGLEPEGEPFEIPMQGMGAFSCRTAVWPGFNPAFRGFGGEEGYIHEKFRQRGGRCLCLPWLRWVHRFGRSSGPPYPLAIEDKLRNYLIGFLELGLDLEPALEHFAEFLLPRPHRRGPRGSPPLGHKRTPGGRNPSPRARNYDVHRKPRQEAKTSKGLAAR